MQTEPARARLRARAWIHAYGGGCVKTSKSAARQRGAGSASGIVGPGQEGMVFAEDALSKAPRSASWSQGRNLAQVGRASSSCAQCSCGAPLFVGETSANRAKHGKINVVHIFLPSSLCPVLHRIAATRWRGQCITSII